MKKFLSKHDFLRILIELRGNPRACVYTEPMWGLSMNLCIPYASLYMVALGLSDSDVGTMASIYMLSQTVFAFLSGMLIDKMGRRLSTAVFDFLSWSVPSLIWASSQGFWFFVVAAALNGMMKIPTVSWACLLVEDAPKNKITRIYSWIMVFANASALFAPISSILVARLTLVPAMRILYINAFIVMTAKLLLLFKFSTETGVGRVKREASRQMTWGQMFSRYKVALRMIFTSRATVFALVVGVLLEISTMIGTTFWQIVVAKHIGVPEPLLPVFPMAKSFITIVLFFTIVSKIKQSKLKWPLYGGFASSIIGCVLLVSVPDTGALGYLLLSVSILFESLGGAVLSTLRESLAAIHVDPEERAGIMAMIQTSVMACCIPFGWFAGWLSETLRILPFILSIALLTAGIAATAVFFRRKEQPQAETSAIVIEENQESPVLDC
jgi:MFS family permease